MSDERGYSWYSTYQLSEAEQITRLAEGETRWDARAFTAILCALLALLWFIDLDADWFDAWAVGWPALREGQFQTIFLHMFAHAGLVHLVLNASALWWLGPQVIARFGRFPNNVGRFVAFYLLSGLVAAVTFLLLRAYGNLPMVGASGAICGLLGLMWRVCPDDDRLLPPWTRRTRLLAVSFAIAHIPLLMYFGMSLVEGSPQIRIAWEAHLGGLLFGFLVGPKFLEFPERDPIAAELLTAETDGQ